VGVDEKIVVAAPNAALDLRLTPNPARGAVAIALALPAGEDRGAQVTVYDVHGARVADVFRGRLPAGHTALRWDGRDDAARPVPSGVYFVRATAGAETVTKKVALIR
jgi:flagellar hook assembly protein FlgD